MKTLYLAILDLLKSVPELRFIDKDKGQLEQYQTRPAVAFPCCLVKIDIPRIETLSVALQRHQAIFTLRVAFDYIGSTNADTPVNTMSQSLEYFDIVEKVQDSIQSKYFKNHPIAFVSALEENRPDGLLILNLRFQALYETEIPTN
jgi:hypothetical protein